MSTCTVLPGLDRLAETGFAAIAGKTVAIVTNHTGRSIRGDSIVDLLQQQAGATISCIFTPEHGLTGKEDAEIPDGTEPISGIRVISLYGPRNAPEPADLYDIDLLVYDIQDAGCRFYTYISTLLGCMKSVSFTKTAMLVLDRPNPIGGLAIEGPLPDIDLLSFTACHPVPLRHGLTVGELAKLFNAELNLHVDLAVEPVGGLKRSMWWSDMLLPWINPSPNLRTPAQALLYPGAALCEFTNISVGRGTDTPFQLIGAPWIDGNILARAMSPNIVGLAEIPVKFTPRESTFLGNQCGGVLLEILDRESFRPVHFGLCLIRALIECYPSVWQSAGLLRLLANRAVYNDIVAGKPLNEIEEGWQPSLCHYRERIAEHLLYP